MIIVIYLSSNPWLDGTTHPDVSTGVSFLYCSLQALPLPATNSTLIIIVTSKTKQNQFNFQINSILLLKIFSVFKSMINSYISILTINVSHIRLEERKIYYNHYQKQNTCSQYIKSEPLGAIFTAFKQHGIAEVNALLHETQLYHGREQLKPGFPLMHKWPFLHLQQMSKTSKFFSLIAVRNEVRTQIYILVLDSNETTGQNTSLSQ